MFVYLVLLPCSYIPEPLQKPVCFQVDYVEGMPNRMPSRLAERMEAKAEPKTFIRQVNEMLNTKNTLQN